MQQIVDELKSMIDRLQNMIDNIDNNQNITELETEDKHNVSKLFLNDQTYEIKVMNTIKTLTCSEFIIMQKLLDSNEMFCTYKELCNSVYDYKYDSSTSKSLKIMMHRLRIKLKGLVKFKTIKCRGYGITEVKGYDRRGIL